MGIPGSLGDPGGAGPGQPPRTQISICGDGERDYETFTGQTRRGLHHTQLGVSTSVLSQQGPGLTDSLVSLVL